MRFVQSVFSRAFRNPTSEEVDRPEVPLRHYASSFGQQVRGTSRGVTAIFKDRKVGANGRIQAAAASVNTNSSLRFEEPVICERTRFATKLSP